MPTNIREIAEVERLVAAALERFGAIDFLVNNAGGQFPARPTEISDRGWRSVVDLNLNGTWNMCNRVGRAMVERGYGVDRQHRAHLLVRARRAAVRALRAPRAPASST